MSIPTHQRKPGLDKLNIDWIEPHQRGEILVAAVTQTLILMWRKRLEALINEGALDRGRAAEEGAKAARHLLEMCIRAIDYCPPVDFEYEDFLTAVLVSDAEVAPDDELGYRAALQEAFERFGIVPSPVNGRPEGLAWRDFNFQALRADRDEVFRFVWDNAEALGIDPRYHLTIESVVPSRRLGPNGFVVNETVVDYLQQLSGTASELRRSIRKLTLPPSLKSKTRITMYGGGTLIFDQFGAVKYHVSKPMTAWDRQARRLEFLVAQEYRDTSGGFGASFGAPAGQRFARFHQAAGRGGEEW